MMTVMTNELDPNRHAPILRGKTTERRFVAYTRFRGILNAPSRIWMVHDWAKSKGYHLVGTPCCLVDPNAAETEERPCEVQWEIAEPVEPTDGEVGTRWAGPPSAVATPYLA